MKKLIIAIAMIAVAGIVQAAQVQWSVTSIVTKAGVAPVTDDNYVAKVLFFTAVSDGAGGYTVGSQIADATVGGTTSVALTGGSVMSKKTNDSFAASTKFYAQLVIDNGTYKIESEKALFTTPGTGNATLNFTTGKSSFDTESAKIDFAKGWTGGTTPTPEPTSGLLLVLGMAGLALRRKRA